MNRNAAPTVKRRHGLLVFLLCHLAGCSAEIIENRHSKANDVPSNTCEPTTTYLYAISAGLRIGYNQHAGSLPNISPSTPILELGNATIGQQEPSTPTDFNATIGRILTRPNHILVIGVVLAVHQNTDSNSFADVQNEAVNTSIGEMNRIAEQQLRQELTAYLLLTGNNPDLSKLQAKFFKALEEVDNWARTTTESIYRGL